VLKLVEILIGMAVIYFGMEKICQADQAKSLMFGLIAIAGLIIMFHGLLVYLVPGFFGPG